MTNAFNAQSDAVIIVEQEPAMKEQFQVKFCNSKSIDIFGVDLQR